LVELFREARRWLPGYKRELRAAIDDAALASLDRAGALQEEKQE